MIINDNYYSKIASNTDLVRNVCILGHIDHGKTTLADNLLSHNKVISNDSVGSAMFMDYRQDEKERQITMKSSCFSCIHIDSNKKKPFLINFVDSPGHVDFVHEISAAINLADSGLIVIDVMEGVCSQTREVLKQSIEMNLKMILLINKIDRLFDFGRETDEELILYKIRNCIEDANAYISSFSSQDKYFDPLFGNVIFSSFKDKWAFDLKAVTKYFGQIILKEDFDKYNFDELLTFFWKHFYFKKSRKEFLETKSDQNVFSTVVIRSLLNRYRRIYEDDLPYIQKIEEKLNVQFEYDSYLNSYKDKNFIVSESMKFDFPASFIVFQTIINDAPSPIIYDFDTNLIGRILRLYPIKNLDMNLIIKSFGNSTEFSSIRSNLYCILSHVKVMQSDVSVNQELFIEGSCNRLKVLSILIQMGKDLIEVTKAYKGTIVTILFQEQSFLKTGMMLYSDDKFIKIKDCKISSNAPASSSMLFSDPITSLLSVNIIPKDPLDYIKLRESLKCLAQCEDSIKFSVDNDSGNLMLSTNGEIHLEKAIFDAKEIFSSNIEFNISQVIVPLKEIIKFDIFSAAKLKRIKYDVKINDSSFLIEAYAYSYYPSIMSNLNIDSVYDEVISKLENPSNSDYKLYSSGNQKKSLNYIFLNQNICSYAAAFLKESFSNVISKGPLCQEPLFGVGIIVDKIEFNESLTYTELAPHFNESINFILKENFKINDYRIYWPIYKCFLTCSINQIREFNYIIRQRWGEIIGKNYEIEIIQGNFINLEAEIPVFKSIGLYKEIQKSTSGNIVPRLEFSHWEVLDNDAFWIPKTNDELEDFGANSIGSQNFSRKIVDQVREMKGIKTEEVLVKDSNKQRTLTKSK